MVLISVTCLELLMFFIYYLVRWEVDERTWSKIHLAVTSAFLRKLNFWGCTEEILIKCLTSHVCPYKTHKAIDVCFCAVVMLVQHEVFFYLLIICSAFVHSSHLTRCPSILSVHPSTHPSLFSCPWVWDNTVVLVSMTRNCEAQFCRHFPLHAYWILSDFLIQNWHCVIGV